MARLSLSRNVGERICIGNDITVQVVKVRGNKVRLCVEAPRDVKVDREEVRQQRERGE